MYQLMLYWVVRYLKFYVFESFKIKSSISGVSHDAFTIITSSVVEGGSVFFYDSLTKKAVCHYGVNLKGDVLHCNRKIQPGTMAVMTDFLEVHEQDPIFSVNTTRFMITQVYDKP